MSKINAELALALALDGKLSRVDDETAMLVAVVDALRALPEPEIDQTFTMALEHRLLTEGLEAETVPAGRPQLSIVPVQPAPVEEDAPVADNVFTLPARRFRMRKSVASIAACFMLGAFPIMATAGALPGSPFYGLKQNLRAAKIALFGGPLQDARWRLEYAAEHVREAEALVALGASQELVAEALDLATYEFAKATDTVNEVDDPDALARFAEEARETQQLLQKSGPTLAPEAQAAFDRAMDAAQALTDQIATALGIDRNAAAQTVASLAGEVTRLVEEAPQATPQTSDVETSGTAKVPSGEESAPDGTKPADDGNDGDAGTTDPDAGRHIREAGEHSCTFAGAYELNELTSGTSDQTCDSAAILIVATF